MLAPKIPLAEPKHCRCDACKEVKPESDGEFISFLSLAAFVCHDCTDEALREARETSHELPF